MYKFKAACTLKLVDGEPCTKVIREEFEAQLPTDENTTLDESDPDDAKKILALKQNEQVMAMLMIAMHTKEGMSKVMQEMTAIPSSKQDKLGGSSKVSGTNVDLMTISLRWS